MLVPLSWLRDFAPFDVDPRELAEVLDNLGMVVEGITRVGEGLDGVFVARVVEVGPIEGADKIRRVVVDDGRPDPVQVVCGAWNFGEGDTVAFARVGAVLPGGFEIGRRKMKGVESNGMICSLRELELGDDHTGIWVLPPGLEPGMPVAEAMGIEADVVYDLAIEGNRPDANSVAGVARDAAAKLRLPFAIPEPPPIGVWSGDGGPVHMAYPVVESPDLCPRFSATVFPGSSVGPSPSWLARRLTLAGMRPINNLVDVSNYVMLELGQPTHPYDLDKLRGGGLRVRAARPGETLVTLDDVERRLGEGPYPDCVICDAEDVVIGIAGIMGGASTEIDSSTTNVLLEAAHFDRMSVARTSKRLGLRTEASARFERGTDPGGIERSVARYAELLGATSSAQAMVGDVPRPAPIIVRTARVNEVLGTALSDDEVRGYLPPLGFEVSAEGPGLTSVVPPTFRPDQEAEIDVVEEVARHHGYERIERTQVSSPYVGGLNPWQRERRFVRDVLCGTGTSEAIGPMLVGPGDHARAGLPEGPDDVILAEDPLAREESVLRTSLLPGLLRAVAFNAGHRNADVRLFEVGHTYGPPPAGETLPDEREHVSAALAGGSGAPDAVRAVRVLLDALRVDDVRLVSVDDVPGMHPTRTASVTAGGRPIGVVGEVAPTVLADWGIDGRVGWFDFEAGLLHGAPRRPEAQRPLTRFPSADIDLAFVVPDAVPADEVEATIRSAVGELLESVRLFDVYRGTGVPSGSRSLAYRLRLRALDRTLTDTDIADVRRRAIDAATAAHEAQLR